MIDPKDHLGLVHLVLHTMRLRVSLKERYREDLLSAGYVALVEAAQRFDHERGPTFSTYACKCIKGQMLTELGRHRPYDLSLEGEDGHGIIVIAGCPEDEHRSEVCLSVASILDGLEPSDRELLERIYGVGRPAESLTDIASALGISKQAVDQRRDKAIGRARDLALRVHSDEPRRGT